MYPHKRGFFARYVSLIGRLIYEYAGDRAWETEMLATLREDAFNAIELNNDHDPSNAVELNTNVGSSIVRSSLAAIKDTNAHELFSALAMAPEDVPVPMSAVKLMCAAHMGRSPDTTTLEDTMDLRKALFTLLDRNLLIGEPRASSQPQSHASKWGGVGIVLRTCT